MEVGDITTVASRKRISADVEQLRDKVSKETAKIIKLKVAQDTAYWDLKEKLHQVEGNHERLQQNMVEVQMQHETISGQYQEELRLRPETLNKVSGTREICSVLESYSLRLKDTLARCRGDHAALLEAMQRAGGALKTASEKTRVGETALKDMEERVKLATEHQNQLLQLFSVTKQQSDKEIHELKVKLEAALQSKEELVHSLHEMNRKMDMCSFDIGKKEEAITNLQGDIKQLIQELSIQSSEAKNALDKQQKDLAAALEANFSLKNTIQEQESLIKNICEQKIGLEHKITVLENQQANDSTQIQDMKRQLQEAAEVNEKNKYDLGVLEQEKEKLAEEVEEKKKLLITQEEGIKKITQEMDSLVNENRKINEELQKAAEEAKERSERIEELTLTAETLVKKTEEAENCLKNIKETSDEKIRDLTTTIEGLNKELDSKAMTITQLMSELKTSTDVRSKLETTLQRLRKENEIEREKTTEKERLQSRRIEQLEETVRDREEELTKHVLDSRAEKEHLQEKIQGMQNTIDNIQKELTGRPAVVENRIQPEQDDNAVMLTPGQKKPQAPLSPIIPKKGGFLVPQKELKQRDSMLYNLFSDSSMEGDTLDASEVNRRFEALSRGERVSPMPLTALKRRGGVSAPHTSLKYRTPINSKGAISLSQAKNDMNKERSFFKNKRLENKTKKNK